MLLDTPICDFGWKAPNFILKDYSGKTFEMSKNMGKKGLLIAFICNHCPYVKAIAKHLAQDTKILIANGINVLAVMSNNYEQVPEDSPENMAIFAKDNNFKFPYLVDGDQKVGRAYGAICTPDFFGFNNKGVLQYRGRLDNLTINKSSNNRVPELVNAMHLIAKTGEGPEHQKPSMGCSIKWHNK